jgi:hypothetical protein
MGIEHLHGAAFHVEPIGERLANREDSAARASACLEDGDVVPFREEIERRGEASHPSPDHDDRLWARHAARPKGDAREVSDRGSRDRGGSGERVVKEFPSIECVAHSDHQGVSCGEATSAERAVPERVALAIVDGISPPA